MVLAVLLASSNRVVSRDELIERAWNGSPPPAAKTSLFTYLSHLRGELGSDAIEHVDGGYLVKADPNNLDALEFAHLMDSGSASLSSDPAGAAKLFDRALRLWRGPPFGDLGDEPALSLDRTHLEELRLVAEEKRIDAYLTLGRHETVVGELSTLVEQNPFRERFLSQLMVALYRSGRQADALRVFAEARRRFAEELGVDPSPPLWALEERILSHDSALLYPPDQALPIGARDLQPMSAALISQKTAVAGLSKSPGEYFAWEAPSAEGTTPMRSKRWRRAVTMIIGALIVGGFAGLVMWSSRDTPAFVITGLDAATLEFSAGFEYSAESWTVEVFVGYVYADSIRYADGTIVRPHTSTDVRLCAYPADEWCEGPSTVLMSGSKDLLDSTAANLVGLTSATLDEITLTVSDGEDAASVTVDLDWGAYGDAHQETDGQNIFQSKDATIAGTVAITGADTSNPISIFNGETLNTADVSVIRLDMTHDSRVEEPGERES
ncbi:MAG TPA: AfsR/SARP family transcriptional regulator [Acidimicrobiia bacterium]